MNSTSRRSTSYVLRSHRFGFSTQDFRRRCDRRCRPTTRRRPHRQRTPRHRAAPLPRHRGRRTRAGAKPVRGDIVNDGPTDFVDRIAGHDAVGFCAGAGGGGDQVEAIDGQGPGKLAQAAARAGLNRFVLVSVFMDAWRGDQSPGAGFEQYMAAKRTADVDLATNLNFLIVRPGTLTQDDGTGLVNAGISVAYDEIPRDDVAAFIAASLFTPHLNRTAMEITRGDTLSTMPSPHCNPTTEQYWSRERPSNRSTGKSTV
nr:NAD(P)H-binding protein [Mycobacterium sp. PS03-16]